MGLALGDSLEAAIAKAAEVDRLKRLERERAEESDWESEGGLGKDARRGAGEGGRRSGNAGLP